MTARRILLTGFPSNELARKVLTRLLESDKAAQVTCLVPERFMERARTRLELEPDAERVSLLLGDVAHLDLGLSGEEYNELAAELDVIHNCAAVTYTGAPLAMAEQCNVVGAGEIVELARASKKLQRVVHWSTTAATSARDGVVWEDDLLEPTSGRLAHTRYLAELAMQRARAEIPVTVLRPSMLAGDSRTGSYARIEGPHLLVSGLLNAPRDLPIPRPARSEARLQVVPIDFAVEAGIFIAEAQGTVSRTFHIIDPAPPTLREAMTTIAELVGRPAPRGGLPPAIARALVRIPLVDKLVHAHKALVDELGRGVRYDDTNAREVLSRAGLSCPPFSSYVEKLVENVKRELEAEGPEPAHTGSL